MITKIKIARRILMESISGWLSLTGQVFTVFALFSMVVVALNLGLSPIFETLLDFYYGFREIIFWPFTPHSPDGCPFLHPQKRDILDYTMS